MSADIRNSADIIGVIGASGMGKGVYVKGELRRVPRSRPIIVWSLLERTDNYAAIIGGQCVHTITALVEAIKAGKTRLVFVPNGNTKELKLQFDRFCRVVWELEGWVVVVEELSNVTTASWAPPAWKKISTAGRHRGLRVYGIAQRPAQTDKDFFGNCTEIHCYAVGSVRDAKVMADTMFCTPQEIMALPKFHYLHRDVQAKVNTPGVVKLPKS